MPDQTATQTPNNIELEAATAEWPDPTPVEPERVLRGSPALASIPMDHQPHRRLGLWRSTPGAFATDHAGYTEFIHIVSGKGRLVSEEGVVTELFPGKTVVMPSGWVGRWEIDELLTKTYAVVPDVA